ncbi:MAG: DUF4160 domain-containing protein [Candidatus Protochlamydia sp.]|nr:DUF4160 domain-containing protein [Candidatus Protochlamydia sp.]
MIDIVNLKQIKIKMEKDKELTPFVYAFYESYEATFSIRTGNRINGQMPPEQMNEIETWIVLNQEKLQNTWNKLDI